MQKDGGAHSHDGGHGSHHQSGVRERGEREAVELDKELQRHTEQSRQRERHPLRQGEDRPVQQKQRQKRHGGKEEAVEDHVADRHFTQRKLAEEEAGAPQRGGRTARQQTPAAACRLWRNAANGPVLCLLQHHLLTLAYLGEWPVCTAVCDIQPVHTHPSALSRGHISVRGRK